MFMCLECKRKFRTTKAAERASYNGCPGCGGVDIDLAPIAAPARPKVARPRCLDRSAVLDAALTCGLEPRGMEARNFMGHSWEVELLAYADGMHPAVKQKTAESIASRLGTVGYVVSLSVLDTSGFDCIFTLQS